MLVSGTPQISHDDWEKSGLSFACLPLDDGRTLVRVDGPKEAIDDWTKRNTATSPSLDNTKTMLTEFLARTKARRIAELQAEIAEAEKLQLAALREIAVEVAEVKD